MTKEETAKKSQNDMPQMMTSIEPQSDRQDELLNEEEDELAWIDRYAKQEKFLKDLFKRMHAEARERKK